MRKSKENAVVKMAATRKKKTDDIFGKDLEEFRQRPELGDDGNHAPLIFWLLAGFFRHNARRFFTTGVYRVTSSDTKVRELELHLSQGNFGYLESQEQLPQKNNIDPNVVANYLKRVLRQMKTPLVPQAQFDEIGRLNL